MTYKEEWKLKNPGSDFTPFVGCPKDENGYDIECPKALNCPMCWDQEIPEANPAETENVHQPVVDREEPPTIKDSGDRTQFDTGAVRDLREGKGRCDLMPLEVVARCYDRFKDVLDTDGSIFLWISEFQKTNDTEYLLRALDSFDRYDAWSDMFLEVAKHFEEGAKKYGENNWQKGIPVHCYIDSAVRHYLKWLRGDKDEPHDRAFVWNIVCCIWEVDYREKKEN